jgi:tetratricopeptide (TPR) repeat protein
VTLRPRRSGLVVAAWLAAWATSLATGCTAAPHDAQPPLALLDAVPPDLAAAEARWRARPADIDALVWYGRRLAYEGRFEEAVAVYTDGLRRHPGNPELLRHRGHRFISLRRFDDARRDLEQAAAALAGAPDRIELDGAPNAHRIPRGTLHTNAWYHLGLAYHLLGRDAEAAEAFARCLALAPNDDFRVAAAYWRALALVHVGRADDARALAGIYAGRELELMESFDYAELLRLIAGVSPRALADLEAAATPLAGATLAYGVAMWHRLEGREDEARARLDALLATEPSSAFGRLAAEVERARMR